MTGPFGFGEPTGQGWLQLGELALAFLVSAMIGLEREFRQKSAGLRTHSLVGFASALIVLVSKYGFTDVLLPSQIVLDPSRVAAQIVSGIGFIGGGLIFVRRDVVRGLTTAASIWLTASVGMACGAGLPVLALTVVAGYFVVVFLFPVLVRRLPRSSSSPTSMQISYHDERDVLRHIVRRCTTQGFVVGRMEVDREVPKSKDYRRVEPSETPRSDSTLGMVVVNLDVHSAGSVSDLVALIAELEGVLTVVVGDDEGSSD